MKLIPKIFRKKNDSKLTRITNDTLAEHREKVLSEGRRFKYPLQYAKHKIIINTIVISVLAVIGLSFIGWWQLYIVKNSSDVFYRVTEMVPLPVAKVNGENALFSDFLLNYRASKFYLTKYDDVSIDSQGGRSQLLAKERDALDVAEADALAKQIGRQRGISVSQSEVDLVLTNLRSANNGKLSEKTSEESSMRILGMSPSDLSTSIYNSILRAKASFAVDQHAKSLADDVQAKLASTATSSDFQSIINALDQQDKSKVSVGNSGMVSSSAIFSGLVAADIAKLDVGQVSGPLKSITNDGYFFVKVTKKTADQVSFEFLRIRLDEFANRLTTLKKQGKVIEYITIASK